MYKIIVLLISLTFINYSFASVKVIALFQGKAYLSVEGEKKIVADGEQFKGYTLIQATGRWAKIKNNSNGDVSQITVGSSIKSNYKKPINKTLKIYPDSIGMYQVTGAINKSPISFLVDTGATFVAMSEKHAKSLGLKYKTKGKRSISQTASGRVNTWVITLDSVEVGGIKVSYVPAAVIQGDHPYQVLLGMSYLKHINVQQDGTVMLLKNKY